MSTPSKTQYRISPARLNELTSNGMNVDDAVTLLKNEPGAAFESPDAEDEEPRDQGGSFDYQKAERQHRMLQAAAGGARPTPAKIEHLVRSPEARGKRLFSSKTSILVPEKPDYPKIHFLCKQLGLAAGAPALLIGISQSGKTFLAQALGLCVATGKPLLGTLEVRKGQVVHIDYEQGRELTRIRYLRLMKGMGLTPSDLAEGDLDLYRESKKLDEAGAEDELSKKLAGKALCIIDSLRASISGEKDENSSSIRETIDMLGRVSETSGCTVLILHHQGKGTVRDDRFASRGSSAIFEAAGSAFSLEVTGEYPEKVYRLWQTKTRMGHANELRYQLTDVGAQVEEIGCSEGIALVSSVESPKRSVEDRIVDALRQKTELAAEELAKAVGGQKQRVVETREKMVRDGLIDLRPRKSGKGEVYFLTETGAAWGSTGT
jgi:hypothetical protein